MPLLQSHPGLHGDQSGSKIGIPFPVLCKVAGGEDQIDDGGGGGGGAAVETGLNALG